MAKQKVKHGAERLREKKKEKQEIKATKCAKVSNMLAAPPSVVPATTSKKSSQSQTVAVASFGEV